MEGLVFVMAIFLFSLIYWFVYSNRARKDIPLEWKDLLLLKMKLQLMTPREFEVFCAELFTLRGEEAIVTKATGDGGVDVIVYNKDKTETYIECKLYDKEKDSIVTRPIAMKLAGAMWHEEKMSGNKVNGMIFHTSRVTDDCKKFCKDMKIELMDTDKIFNMAREIGTSKVLFAAGIMGMSLKDDIYSKQDEVQVEG